MTTFLTKTIVLIIGFSFLSCNTNFNDKNSSSLSVINTSRTNETIMNQKNMVRFIVKNSSENLNSVMNDDREL